MKKTMNKDIIRVHYTHDNSTRLIYCIAIYYYTYAVIDSDIRDFNNILNITLFFLAGIAYSIFFILT